MTSAGLVQPSPARPVPSVRKRLGQALYWTLLGNVAAKVLTAVSSIVVARILGPKAFGEYGIIQSTVLMLSVYGAFRLGNTAVKYVAEYRHTDPGRALRILKLALDTAFVLCLVMALGVIVGSHLIAETLLHDPGLAGSLRLGGFVLFFVTYGAIAQQALAGFEDFRAMALNNGLKGLLTPLVCIPMAWFWGVNGAIAGLAIVAALILPQVLTRLRRAVRGLAHPGESRLKGNLKEISVLWHFALPGFLLLALINTATWCGKVLVARNPAGLADLGVYEAAGQWTTLIYFLPAILGRVALPILSERHGQQAYGDFRDAFWLQLRAVAWWTLPLSVGLIALASQVERLYGPHFRGVQMLVPALVVGGFLRTLNETIRIVYESTSRQWLNLMMYGMWALALVATSVALVRTVGAFGFCLASLVAEGTLFLTSGWFARSRLVRGQPDRVLEEMMFAFGVLVAAALVAGFAPMPVQWAAMPALLILSFWPAWVGVRETGLAERVASRIHDWRRARRAS